MDPLSIAASVGALTATCLSTCKKLSDLAGNYQDVPVVLTMICTETTVINIALSELQKNILQRQDLSQAWASRTDVLVAFETALTGCMIVFSCLEAETRQLQSLTPNSSGMRVWAKLKFLWNQDRLKELLSALRGQQSSINFLLQVLEINTLSDIERNIRDNKSAIQNPASEAQSLRSNNPSVKMESQSIFDNENTRLSLFDADAISGVAPSELDFDFDGLVLNSQAYRRVFAQAQSDANLKSQIPVTEAFSLHFSDGATLQRVNHGLQVLNVVPASRPRQSTSFRSSLTRSMGTMLGERESASWEIGDLSSQPGGESTSESTIVEEGTDLVTKEPLNLSQLTSTSEHTCGRCSAAIVDRFVREQGETFHPDCFTCADCGETIRSKFFPPKDNPHAQICERDYFRRLGLLCHLCGQGLDRTYIMSGNKKYHVRHLRSELPLASYDAEDVSPEGQFPDDMENDVQVYDYNRIGYFMEIVWAYYEGLAFLCLVMSPKEAISHNSKPDGLQQDTVTSADIETAC